MTLTSKQVRHLRGLAHHIKPVVQVGNRGLTPEVLLKVTTELENHELIKVKHGSDERHERLGDFELLAQQVSAELVQNIGRTGVLYKRRKKEPEIVLPKT
jgi:RNA-binding protein